MTPSATPENYTTLTDVTASLAAFVLDPWSGPADKAWG